MNIYDVSSKANVSIATVSRVLNGNPNVSPQTRQKVLSVMKELGYTPNVFARGLGLNTMNTIGIVCCDSSDLYLANAIFYLEQGLRTFGYDALLCCTGYSLKTKMNYMKLMLSKRVDAIIIVGSMFLDSDEQNNQYILDAAKQIPVFLVNGHLEGKNIHCTLCDDYQAVLSATNLLIAAGHTSLFYLYSSESYSGRNKLRGFTDACALNGIPAHYKMLPYSSELIQQSRELLLHLHEDGSRFNGILSSDDALAVGAVKYAIAKGISIPTDFSVVGYNNSILATCCEPELSSVDTRITSLCDHTVHAVMEVLNGGTISDDTVISAQFIERSTTALLHQSFHAAGEFSSPVA